MLNVFLDFALNVLGGGGAIHTYMCVSMCIRSWGSVRVYDYDGNSKTLTTWPEPLCRHRACSCFFVFDVIVSCQYRCTRKTRASSISCPHATVHRLLHVNHMSIEDMAKHVCQLCDVRVCVDQEKSRTCCGKDRIGQMFRSRGSLWLRNGFKTDSAHWLLKAEKILTNPMQLPASADALSEPLEIGHGTGPIRHVPPRPGSRLRSM
ncbi:unnamed protein product [Durusdinium trenchii]|uniref:Secreted protein n=1 Tax=Durusdinium trenchii TaxID=1381693 RepID=A0ABP0R821_9DINO